MSAIPLPVNADSGATGNDETDIAMSSTHQPPLQLSAYDTSVGQSIGFTPLFHNPAILQDFQDMEAIAAADAYFDHQDYQDSQMGMLGPEDIVAPWSFISTVNNFTLNHSSNTPQDIEPEADVTEADMMEAQQIAWFGDMMNDVGASTPSAFSGHTPSAHMLTQQTQQIQEGQGQLAISADQHAPPHATSTAPISFHIPLFSSSLPELPGGPWPAAVYEDAALYAEIAGILEREQENSSLDHDDLDSLT